MKIDLPSSGIGGRTPSLIPAQHEYPVRFEIGLNYKQVPFAAQAHISNTVEKKREPRRRLRWEPTYARQQLQNSLQSQSLAEHKSQDTKENPEYTNSRKKTHLDLANVVDLSEAQDSPKGAVLDTSLPSSNSRPTIADFKISGKTPRLPEALFGVAIGGKNKSGSVFEGRFRGNHFKLREANDTDQKISRSIKMTGSAAAVMNPGILNEPTAPGTSELAFQDHSLPSSNLRPEIADFMMVRERTSHLPEALFGMAIAEKNKIGSVFERRLERNNFKIREANETDQKISRSIKMASSAAALIHPGIAGGQSVAGTSEQPFPDNSLPSSNLRPEIADFKMVREKTTPLLESLFGMAKGENYKSGSVFERRPEGNNLRLKKGNDIDQKISRSIEITGTAAAVMQPNTGIKQSAASMSEQPFLDQSLPFSELRPQITDLANNRKNGSFLVKSISIGSMPDGRSRAGHLEVRKAVDSYQEAARNPEKAVSAPPAANGKSAIQVTIGRIEVRAERPNRAPSAPPLCRPASVSRLSLDEYLKQRSAGQI